MRTARTVQLRDVVLGEGLPKVIVPVTGASGPELLAEVDALAGHRVDIVEWRVDYLDGAPDRAAVAGTARSLRERLGERPLLATFRTAAEGGQKAISDEDYAGLLRALVDSGDVDAVDVEFFRGDELVRGLIEAAHARGVPVVASNHDFDATPPAEEIVARLRAMEGAGADVAKLACTPHDTGDLLTLLSATWQMSAQHAQGPIITMSMGQVGMLSRLTGAFFGSAATFGMVGRASAPGQIPVEELNELLTLMGRWAPKS